MPRPLGAEMPSAQHHCFTCLTTLYITLFISSTRLIASVFFSPSASLHVHHAHNPSAAKHFKHQHWHKALCFTGGLTIYECVECCLLHSQLFRDLRHIESETHNEKNRSQQQGPMPFMQGIGLGRSLLRALNEAMSPPPPALVCLCTPAE